MPLRPAVPFILLAPVTLLLSLDIHARDARIDEALNGFWAASSPQQVARAIDQLIATGLTFEDAFARLKAGRTYSKDVPTGIVRASRTADGRGFFYSIEVPAGYDPSRSYQVRFQLHGGVTGREDNGTRGSGGIGELAGDEQIYILPSSWVDAPWWGGSQLKNFRGILDTVKRSYNIDENRVVVSGVSDGGTAAFYIAMRDITPYASQVIVRAVRPRSSACSAA
jgi:poly(3-hydroxybutyrate) depolymerase